MTGTEVARRTPMAEVCEAVLAPEFRSKIAVAIGSEREANRFTRIAVTAVQQNPDIVKAKDRGSILLSLSRCAQDGLLPDGTEAALVRRGEKVTYQPMVAGLRKIATNYGFRMFANCVYENDFFEYELGFEPKLTHIPAKLGTPRGEMIGAYAVAEHGSHGRFLEVMNRDEIDHIKKASVSGASGPWANHYTEMARKTAVKRLFKQLPIGAMDEGHRVALSEGDDDYDFSSPVDDLPTVNLGDDDDEAPEQEVHDPEQGILA